MRVGCSLPAPLSVLGWRAGHPSAANLAAASCPVPNPGQDILACPWGPPADRSGMAGPGLLGRWREVFVTSKNVFCGVPTPTRQQERALWSNQLAKFFTPPRRCHRACWHERNLSSSVVTQGFFRRPSFGQDPLSFNVYQHQGLSIVRHPLGKTNVPGSQHTAAQNN